MLPSHGLIWGSLKNGTPLDSSKSRDLETHHVFRGKIPQGGDGFGWSWWWRLPRKGSNDHRETVDGNQKSGESQVDMVSLSHFFTGFHIDVGWWNSHTRRFWLKIWDKIFPTSTNTIPETNSSHLKMGRARPKRKGSYSNHPFSGAKILVFREGKLTESLVAINRKASWLENPPRWPWRPLLYDGFSALRYRSF